MNILSIRVVAPALTASRHIQDMSVLTGDGSEKKAILAEG